MVNKNIAIETCTQKLLVNYIYCHKEIARNTLNYMWNFEVDRHFIFKCMGTICFWKIIGKFRKATDAKVIKSNWDLFHNLCFNLMSYKRSYCEQFNFPSGPDIHKLKSIKDQMYIFVLVIFWLCPYGTYRTKALWNMKDDSGVHTHGQLSKEQGNVIPLHSMCPWICMFGYASSLVAGNRLTQHMVFFREF